ncbi:MAG TPA: SRPBCC domain-containing protein [Actinomycetota bacterium]
MATMQTIEPIKVSVRVPLKPDAAFDLFTSKIATWWPVDQYSVGQEKVTDVAFEAREGGEVYEICDDGTRAHWADVLAFEAPKRILLAWKPNPEQPVPTEVEVSFHADGDGTRVALEHRAWERLAERAADARAGYAGGWVTVLGRFEQAAS